jgi:hypothetical protein
MQPLVAPSNFFIEGDSMNKIAILRTSMQGFSQLFGDSAYLIRIAWPLYICGALLCLFDYLTGFENNTNAASAGIYIMMIPYMIKIYDKVVEGNIYPAHKALSTDKYQFKKMGKYLLVSLVLSIPGIAIGVAAHLEAFPPSFNLVALAVGFFLFFALPLTISFVYPAVSTNRDTSIKLAFTQLKGNYVRLFTALAIYCIIFILLFFCTPLAAYILSLNQAALLGRGGEYLFIFSIFISAVTVILQGGICVIIGKAYQQVVVSEPEPAFGTGSSSTPRS